MQVKVFARLREICGGVVVDVFPDGSKIRDVLDKMVEMFPALEEEIFTEDKQLKPFVHVYVNGKNIAHLDHLDTEVSEEDELALFLRRQAVDGAKCPL